MSVAYLEKLNPEQRRAVEHGVRENDATPCTPLLVIAGAGSGKTNTLAHRVAHLIVNGADPRKILLMTFSRRAAAEMARRVERIAREGNRRQRRYHDRCALGRNLPRDWRAALARLCGPDRPRFCFHHSRPRGLGRSDESYAARARILEDGKPVSGQRHMSCRLFAMRQRRVADRGCAAQRPSRGAPPGRPN